VEFGHLQTQTGKSKNKLVERPEVYHSYM
jgi:hypothetical protein